MFLNGISEQWCILWFCRTNDPVQVPEFFFCLGIGIVNQVLLFPVATVPILHLHLVEVSVHQFSILFFL